MLTIDPDSEKVLIQGDETAGDDHHGGEIRYIEDKLHGDKLYYATGDNVCCSVVDGSNSQELDNIYGKVLRIYPDGSVPADNPFHDGNGPNNDAIYAMGCVTRSGVGSRPTASCCSGMWARTPGKK